MKQYIDWHKSAVYLFLVGLGFFLYSGWPAFRADATAYVNTELTVSDPLIQSVEVCDRRFSRSPDGGDLRADISCLAASPKLSEIDAKRGTDAVTAKDVKLKLLVLPRYSYGAMAGGGVLLMLLSAPGMLFYSTKVKVWGSNRSLSGWIYLLTEPQGMSLSRFQLVVWFVPALVVLAILAWPVHQFPAIPEQLWTLLGLGGVTAALGIASTPRENSQPNANAAQPPAAGSNGGAGQPAVTDPLQDVAAAQQELDSLEQALGQISAALQAEAVTNDLSGAAPSPEVRDRWGQVQTDFFSLRDKLTTNVGTANSATGRLKTTLTKSPKTDSGLAQDVVYAAEPLPRDLVEDFNGFGDISRYQYLLLCLGGALTFFVGFVQTWQVPVIPPQILELVAGSQATYLVVKGIKNVRDQTAH